MQKLFYENENETLLNAIWKAHAIFIVKIKLPFATQLWLLYMLAFHENGCEGSFQDGLTACKKYFMKTKMKAL